MSVAPCSDGVRVEVHDGDGEHFPVLRERHCYNGRGRGILLVDELTVRCGAACNGSGKWVWFEVGTRGLPTKPRSLRPTDPLPRLTPVRWAFHHRRFLVLPGGNALQDTGFRSNPRLQSSRELPCVTSVVRS